MLVRVIAMSVLLTYTSTSAAQESANEQKPETPAVATSPVAIAPGGGYETNELNAKVMYSTETAHKIEMLELQLANQTEKLDRLRDSMREVELKSSNDYTATLLTAVAVIVTALGVIIALLSIVGYRNIRNQAKKIARTATENTIREELKRKIDSATKDTIEKLFKDEKLDDFIDDAFQRVIYRGFPEEELNENEKDDNEGGRP